MTPAESARADPERASELLWAVFRWLQEDWEKRTGLPEPEESDAIQPPAVILTMAD